MAHNEQILVGEQRHYSLHHHFTAFNVGRNSHISRDAFATAYGKTVPHRSHILGSIGSHSHTLLASCLSDELSQSVHLNLFIVGTEIGNGFLSVIQRR